jgi:flagellin FlaB
MVKPHRTRITRRMKAIVGIESAIVLIAFVVVAAALAFVVLNMGFFTTQRSKETIGSGLAQASSSIEIDGTVLANVTISGNSGNVTCLLIPIRLSAGQKPVDLTPGKSIISVWILGKAAFPQVYNSTDTNSFTSISSNDITTICNNVTFDGASVNASIVWTTPNNHDNVLDPGEKALIVVRFGNTIAPTAYDVVKVELKVPIGAALTVERSIPASLTQQVIDLG